MAKEIPDLVAEPRVGSGKGAARQARRNGKVPGIVYGDGKEPLAIQMDFNPLLTKLRAGRFMSTLWNLKLEGQDDVRVICRGVQRDVSRTCRRISTSCARTATRHARTGSRASCGACA